MFLFESTWGRDRIGKPNDEFYTRYVDCVKEFQNYDFTNKIVYCNCDDPTFSQIYKYFHDNFNELGLKELYSTYYGEDSLVTIYDGNEEQQYEANENGSFDSPTSISILKKCDIVCTNPPFGSLCRDFIKLMDEYNKDYIVILPYTVLCNPYIISLFVNHKAYSGYNYIHTFNRPDGSTKGAPVFWMTSIDTSDKSDFVRTKPLILESDEEYSFVARYSNIPEYFEGELLVPISFITYWNANEFDILGYRYFKYLGKKKIGLVIKQK